MNFFLYEFITGGGLLAESQSHSGSLLAEGRAMISALAEDFSQLGDVTLMLDERLDAFFPSEVRVIRVCDSHDEQASFAQLAAESDWTLIVAPEFDSILLDRVNTAKNASKQVMNCSSRAIQISVDKQQTAERLAAIGVPVPTGRGFADTSVPLDVPYPAVVKPIDGAGSQDVRYVATHDELLAMSFSKGSWRIESYCPGTAASCAVLCGPEQHIALPACAQHLANDGSFAYLGGTVPLDADLDARARALALQAVAALPETLGYVGVDLVLGNAPDGADDRVIEINPRLTTSYVGLRTLATTNLASAMLAVARGKEIEISWRERAVEFLADGTIVDRVALKCE